VPQAKPDNAAAAPKADGTGVKANSAAPVAPPTVAAKVAAKAAAPGLTGVAGAPEKGLGNLEVLGYTRLWGDVSKGRVYVTDAVVRLGGVRAEAQELQFQLTRGGQLSQINSVGETRVDISGLRFLARGISLTPSGALGEGPSVFAGLYRLGFPPGFMQGEGLEVRHTKNVRRVGGDADGKGNGGVGGGLSEPVAITETTLKGVTIHYQEPDFWGVTVDAGKVVLTTETPAQSASSGGSNGNGNANTGVVNTDVAAATADVSASAAAPSPALSNAERIAQFRENSTLHVEDAVVRIAGVPVFYLPAYTQHGLNLPPLRPVVRAGQKDNIGTFLRTTVHYTGFGRGFEPGLLLDGYAKAGVLVGPALNYNTTGRRPEAGAAEAFFNESPAKGSLQGAWIKDNSNRGTDNYGNPIDPHRGFFIWNHKQDVRTHAAAAQHLEVSASINYWSDTSVLRDFRREEFDAVQRPDSFVELVLPQDGYYASAFARLRPNDFSNVQQRLPEVRLDIPRRELARTGTYHHLNLAFAYLYERTSPEYDIAGIEIESPRFDAYYGVERPLKLGDWLAFTPLAGVRATTYFSPLDTTGANQSDPFTRVLPQLGFDLHLLASGRWEYRNEFWEVNGLRHRLRPVVQYRWIPAADKDAERIPAVDRYTFIPAPPPMDLEQKRYADDLWEQQVLRLGLENVLQTRDPGYGSRDLAWANFYQDFRDTARPGERARSAFYTQLGFAPAPWIDINLFNRLDTYNWASREISATLSLHDGDRWRCWFGAQYTTDISETNQYFWGLEYRLDSNYSLRCQWRFDSEASTLTEQYYALRQRLGNTWIMEYHLGHRRDARRDNGFNFGLNLRMTAF
jgi:LPS-assembly protein